MMNDMYCSKVPEAVLESLCVQAEKDGIERLVVGALILNNKNDIFLMRRAEDEFMGGLLEFPGGGVDEGETLTSALAREVREEAGLTLTEIERYLDSFDYSSESGKRARQFNFLVRTSGEPCVSAEHQSYEWCTLSYARTRDDLDPVFRASIFTLE